MVMTPLEVRDVVCDRGAGADAGGGIGLVLQQEAAAQGAPISFVLVNCQIHDWILLTPDGFQYWPQIDQELGA